jgi:hypothetical protein
LQILFGCSEEGKRWVGHVICVVMIKKMRVRFYLENPKVGRLGHRWNDNINIDVKEIGFENVE